MHRKAAGFGAGGAEPYVALGAQDVGYLAFFLGMHVVTLIGGPLTFRGDALSVCLASYVVIGMLGVSMSYHRFPVQTTKLKS